MGNICDGLCPSTRKDIGITIKTGDVKGKGKKGDVFVILKDKDGNRSQSIKLACKSGSQTFWEDISNANLGRVNSIEIWRKGDGTAHDWFVDDIYIEQLIMGRRQQLPFPLQRWIHPGLKYTFEVYDSSLPQNDPNKEQRREELEERKKVYVFRKDAEGIPPQVSLKKISFKISNE